MEAESSLQGVQLALHSLKKSRDFLKVRHKIFSRITSRIQSCWVRTAILTVLIHFSSSLQIQSSSLHAEFFFFLSFPFYLCNVLLVANNGLPLQKSNFFIIALLMAPAMSLSDFWNQSVVESMLHCIPPSLSVIFCDTLGIDSLILYIFLAVKKKHYNCYNLWDSTGKTLFP